MTARQLTFTRIQDATADDWAIIATRPNTKLFEELPDRLVGALRFLESGDFYTVNGLEHSLQAGTRALRDGRPVEYVVAALLHDIGDLVAPRNHAAVAAAILRPYVSERIAWIVEHHTVFQFNHFGCHVGIDPDMRDAYLDHPYYDEAAEFADLYDSESFDPSYESLPLDEFEPLLRQVFDPSERSPFEARQASPDRQLSIRAGPSEPGTSVGSSTSRRSTLIRPGGCQQHAAHLSGGRTPYVGKTKPSGIAHPKSTDDPTEGATRWLPTASTQPASTHRRWSYPSSGNRRVRHC